jgi:hypothetical protein
VGSTTVSSPLPALARGGHDNGPLVVCTLSDQLCEVAVDGPGDWITPGREFFD